MTSTGIQPRETCCEVFAAQGGGADRQVDVVLRGQCGKRRDRGKYREPREHFDGMGSERRPQVGPGGHSGVIQAGEEQRGHLRWKLPPREAVGEAHRAVWPGDGGTAVQGAPWWRVLCAGLGLVFSALSRAADTYLVIYFLSFVPFGQRCLNIELRWYRETRGVEQSECRLCALCEVLWVLKMIVV